MRMSKLLGRTIKETPRDAELISHQFMLRAGYVRQYAAGVYGLLPLAHRSLAKIENIIRTEMDAIGGQEIKMPCISTKELWEESGRYKSIDKSMFRLRDRFDKDMVLCMTHEEPVVFLARSEISSYRQLPVMMYQIQTKFRDEPRPRGGLIRVREFTMKDAYSFHASEDDLKSYYQVVHKAYERIFTKAGCKNFVSILSDNGMFGGKYSHEFMQLVPAGEDTVITCSKCSYKANSEIATSPIACKKEALLDMQKAHTPNHKTIAEVSSFLQLTEVDTCKAVMFETSEQELVIVFIRGDLEVIDAKVKCLVQKNIVQATPETIAKYNIKAGFVGPISLDLKHILCVFDTTVTEQTNLVIGANEDDYHIKNFNFQRDFFSQLQPWQQSKVIIGDVAAVKAGFACPQCSAPLQETRGIEIGNIFHLGTRYSESMQCTYLDAQGKACYPIMGCYGIGVGRLFPSVVEESHDKYGMILPITIAPYEVHLCALNCKDGEVLAKTTALYQQLSAANIQVLWDDRDEKPGSQFADADLIGIPLRIIVSSKTLAQNAIEFKYRDGRAASQLIPLDNLMAEVASIITAEYKKYNV